MSSTKNVKGNRQIVVATFSVPAVVFKLPDVLDLKDETVVKNWYVKWTKLHIHCVNGEEKKIEWEYEPEIDFKYADQKEIKDADKHCVDYEEDNVRKCRDCDYT